MEGKASAQFRKSMEMQARLLRVYYYNILWHYYGNVPFYLENLSLPYTAPQISADEIYNRLMPELEAIIASEVLPMRWEAGESGRVSQAFAMMLYAEMVMYQNDSARYPQALEFMKKIIADPDYSLNPNFANIWEEDGQLLFLVGDSTIYAISPNLIRLYPALPSSPAQSQVLE